MWYLHYLIMFSPPIRGCEIWARAKGCAQRHAASKWQDPSPALFPHPDFASRNWLQPRRACAQLDTQRL